MAPDENTVQRIVRDNPHLQREDVGDLYGPHRLVIALFGALEDFIIPAPERPRAFVMPPCRKKRRWHSVSVCVYDIHIFNMMQEVCT